MRPVVHYMMGGVHTDIDGATPLPGLYAAGEVACVSINGANRLGSNSLPECWCSAPAPGARRREYAAAPREPDAGGRWRRPRTSSAGSSATCCGTSGGRETHRRRSATRCRRRWRTSAGIYRTGASLRQGRGHAARAAGARRATSRIDDHSRTFNTELIAALELANMLDIAEAIVALARCTREESRGAHQRTDFPARDDERFLTHSLVAPQPGRHVAGRATCR